jgi:hypothetical protein
MCYYFAIHDVGRDPQRGCISLKNFNFGLFFFETSHRPETVVPERRSARPLEHGGTESPSYVDGATSTYALQSTVVPR